jgi:hypothetical protein
MRFGLAGKQGQALARGLHAEQGDEVRLALGGILADRLAKRIPRRPSASSRSSTIW